MRERLLRLAVRLYPASWRHRYGDEFSALLEDAPPRWRDLPDVLKGAIVMQFLHGRFAGICAATGLAGLLLALAVSLTLPPGYSSSATIGFRSPEAVAYLSQHTLSRRSLVSLIQRHDLYHGERRRQPMEDIVEEMRKNIRITTDRERPSAFTVQFVYPDRLKAQAVVGDLTELYATESRRLDGSWLEVRNAASFPDAPQRSFHSGLLAAGLGIGLLAGMVMQRPLRWTLKVAGLGLGGWAIAGGVAFFMPNRYESHALVSGRISGPALAGIQVAEIPMPSNTPKVYALTAAGTDQFGTQRTLRGALDSLRPQMVELIDPPSLPELPVSLHWSARAFGGMVVGLLIGAWRIKIPRSGTCAGGLP
jgi:hypothetical protein